MSRGQTQNELRESEWVISLLDVKQLTANFRELGERTTGKQEDLVNGQDYWWRDLEKMPTARNKVFDEQQSCRVSLKRV